MKFAGKLINTLTLALVFAFCQLPLSANGEEMRTIKGNLQYRERVALPGDAVVVVEARGWRKTLLGEIRIRAEGRQVPLSFSMDLPDGVAAKVTAGILVGGRPRWVSGEIEVAGGTDPVDLGMVPMRAFEPLLFPTTYKCGDREIQVGVLDDEAVMEIGDERIPLMRERSGSGARYAAEGDAETFFWTKGDTAYVSLRGERLDECRRIPPDSPKPYIARGHEPGWSLRIENGQFELIMNTGADRMTAPLPNVRVEAGRYVLEIADPAIRITLSETLCRDTATDMPYPDTVTVETGDTTRNGCGGDPVDLLVGTEWVVEDIGGGGIIDRSHLTLVFDRNGRVSGSGGCNNFNAGFSMSGEGVSFGSAAATMKACSEALMKQERRFFEALAKVSRIDFDPVTNALLLIAGDKDIAIRARRS